MNRLKHGTGRLNPSRETKSSGAYGDRGTFIFPVQLTTSRIGNIARLSHTLLDGHTYIHTIHTYISIYIPTYNLIKYSSEVPRNPLTRWDVSSIPANGIFLTKKTKRQI